MQVGLYESGWRQTEFNCSHVGNNDKTVREQKKVLGDRTLEKIFDNYIVLRKKGVRVYPTVLR